MKSRIVTFFTVSISVILVFFMAVYVLAVLKYKDTYFYGTRINGIKCVGLDVETVNDMLKSSGKVYDITVSSSYGQKETIKAETVSLTADYTNPLREILAGQNALFWVANIFNPLPDYVIEPDIIFDPVKLKEASDGLSVVKKFDPGRPQSLEIELSDNGYFLNDTTGLSVNPLNVSELIEREIRQENYDVTIPDYYFVLKDLTEEEEKTLTDWKDVSSFISSNIVYDMGAEKITIDSAVLSTFLSRDAIGFKRNEDGSLFIDEEKIKAYIDDICDRYETLGKVRKFISVNDEEKTFESNLYGTRIDVKAEEEYILSAVKKKTDEVHVPKYLKEGFVRGLDDIGGTRIEIDLTRQKLYYLVDGEVSKTYDIVSGNPNNDKATPEMLCSVIKKAEDTYLQGEDYKSHVNYWMAIYKTYIGIHDAVWQSSFGGKRYLTNGSKGCINLKLSDAEELYGMVELGTPVLVYK